MFAILKKTDDYNKVGTDSRPFWSTIPPRIALGFVLVALALYGADRIETHLPEQEAEDAALKYVGFIELTVPDLDLVFDNNELTDRARGLFRDIKDSISNLIKSCDIIYLQHNAPPASVSQRTLAVLQQSVQTKAF